MEKYGTVYGTVISIKNIEVRVYGVEGKMKIYSDKLKNV